MFVKNKIILFFFQKEELNTKLKDLVTEMEIAQELADDGRINEIKDLKAGLEEELRIMNAVAPHEVGTKISSFNTQLTFF